MTTLKRIPGAPKEPGWYWIGSSNRANPELLTWSKIENTRRCILWHSGPIPEPAAQEGETFNVPIRKRTPEEVQTWIVARLAQLEIWAKKFSEDRYEQFDPITEPSPEKQPEHSPLPWSIERRPTPASEDHSPAFTIHDGRPQRLYIGACDGAACYANNEANARLIVDAVNQHADLVRLRDVLQQ